MSSRGFKSNRLVIFDLDWVPIDSKNIHFVALNEALSIVDKNFQIPYSDHLTFYDGMNTRNKLEILSKKYGLSKETQDLIWTKKQIATESHFQTITVDNWLIELIREIKKTNIHIAVTSNSIRSTVKMLLENLGLIKYVDLYLGNEDVENPKPFPEIYWRCMTAFKAIPSRTVIFEDSRIGRQGAVESGGHLISIRNRSNLNMEKIREAITFIDEEYLEVVNGLWVSSELNILIPMAGAGSRFSEAGYTFPKPLIEVLGKPKIQAIVENLNIRAHYIFIVKERDYHKFNLSYLLNLIAPGCDMVRVDGLTEGAACTTLLAKELIDSDKSLLIANSDQIIDWDAAGTMYSLESSEIDGGRLTFTLIHPKWSYARLSDQGFVEEVAEKKPISNNATVGIYYWRKGSDYVKYAEEMIKDENRVNGEFYVCPVFNYAIADGKRFKAKVVKKMWGIGTPEDLNVYLQEKVK